MVIAMTAEIFLHLALWQSNLISVQTACCCFSQPRPRSQTGIAFRGSAFEHSPPRTVLCIHRRQLLPCSVLSRAGPKLLPAGHQASAMLLEQEDAATLALEGVTENALDFVFISDIIICF